MICAVFGCTPREAELQDADLVFGVLDYRAAEAAVEAFNLPDKSKSFETLRDNPGLVRALRAMATTNSAALEIYTAAEKAPED